MRLFKQDCNLVSRFKLIVMISVMKFAKLPRSIRQISSHVLAIALGVLLTVSSLRVLPSQADSLSPNIAAPQIIAQQRILACCK
jgi:hypothetical protein